MITDVVKKYRAWKKANPCAEFQHDEIGEFVAGLSRAELLEVMNDVDAGSILPIED